jgi:hypothetical protein
MGILGLNGLTVGAEPEVPSFEVDGSAQGVYGDFDDVVLILERGEEVSDLASRQQLGSYLGSSGRGLAFVFRDGRERATAHGERILGE